MRDEECGHLSGFVERRAAGLPDAEGRQGAVILPHRSIFLQIFVGDEFTDSVTAHFERPGDSCFGDAVLEHF